MPQGKPSRIVVQADGGLAHFPGRTSPWSIELDALSARDRQAVEHALAAANFFDRDSPVRSARAWDGRKYRVSVQLGDQDRTIEITEPIADIAMAELISLLRVMVHEQK